jgi:hypothetical protein
MDFIHPSLHHPIPTSHSDQLGIAMLLISSTSIFIGGTVNEWISQNMISTPCCKTLGSTFF